MPERSPAGVLKALHAGSFWALHGNFLDHLILTVSAPGLAVPASPGEVVKFRRDGEIWIRVAVQRATRLGADPLSAEIISKCRSGVPELLASLTLEAQQDAAEMPLSGLTAGGDHSSCYVRLRVRRKAQDGDDWFAYTNPVRIRLQ